MSEEKKKPMTGGDLLVKALVAENVRFIFGVPGGQLLHIYDAIYQWGREEGIDTIMFRHEQAAAHAADAWYRVTGTIGVCMGTVGPGATHMLPAVAAAWSDSIPVLVITPQVTINQMDIGFLQGDLDQLGIYRPVVKYQKQILKTEKIVEGVQKAFREALSGRPRPVHLDIPFEVLANKITQEIQIREPSQYRPLSNPTANPELVKQAITTLLKAEKPLIFMGGGVIAAKAEKELYELVEYLKVPLATTVMGSSGVLKKTSTFIGGPGVITSNTQKAIMETDLVITFGARFGLSLMFGKPPIWRDELPVIQVDIDPSEIGKNRHVSLGIVGDCKFVLQEMLELVKKQKPAVQQESEWLKMLKEAREKFWSGLQKRMNSNDIPIYPQRLVKEVNEFLDEDAILIIDGGDIAFFALEQVQMYHPRKLLSAIGMGHLGTSIPYAIGAKLAAPKRQVCTISGDGAVIINIQELETAKRCGLPFICVVANNSAWGMIKSGQKYSFKKRFIDVDFSDTNFAEIAKGFGCYGERVTDPCEIRNALERAHKSNKPAILDVIIKFETHDVSKIGIEAMMF
ncbi:MAG TPA: thiamine pyrophosphate-binding protein [Candidatus Deferrimicrobium sp.]|nr:thiamine pyrophosphate-binding protein [Candidatus Deferrimicrobium sp.]